ncbi:NACHT, LRR and PYD domains-containing protein 2-like isoform X2 [Peromyscus maniculatus bairdii]|uniref:NACHT, LRR and PYD domains-containing protein 2-like isoform X2 n=1 Tax=Peromyscus maniculatus bairdii TaxID=230844 RepID=UPI003FD11279
MLQLMLLGEMVKHNRYKLQFLRLGSCSASIHQWNDFLFLHMNQFLTCVDFSGNKLLDGGAMLLCMTLKYPRMENCQLTETYSKELFSFLMVSQKLTHLSLARKNLGDGGVKILCEGLCSPDCKLHVLVLCGCSISPLHQELATAIASNLKLETLDLGQNILGKSGVTVTLDALKDNTVHLTIRSVSGVSCL